MEKKIKIKKIGSLIRQPSYQSKIMRGLGLRKNNSVRELEDTPAVRGMIKKVEHLVEILEEKN
tara:strand:+ start:429 stop:617 length:189 start_codon:yes stop_codon:yes gene_type:complete